MIVREITQAAHHTNSSHTWRCEDSAAQTLFRGQPPAPLQARCASAYLATRSLPMASGSVAGRCSLNLVIYLENVLPLEVCRKKYALAQIICSTMPNTSSASVEPARVHGPVPRVRALALVLGNTPLGRVDADTLRNASQQARHSLPKQL